MTLTSHYLYIVKIWISGLAYPVKQNLYTVKMAFYTRRL